MMRYRMMKWLGLAPRSMSIPGGNFALKAIALSVAGGRAPEGWQMFASSSYTRVASGTWRGRQVYLKVFLPRSTFEGLKNMGRESRGARFADRSIRMTGEEFPAPPVLAYGRASSRLEFVLTEVVPYPVLEDFLTIGNGSCSLPLTSRRILLRAFGAEVARLHQAGWIHGDLRLGNVLCNLSNGIKQPEFWYLDNESNRRSFNVRKQRRNLVQLCMTPRYIQSRTDQLRILEAYAESMNLDRNQYRKMVRRVELRRNYRWRRREARGGPKRRYHPEDRIKEP